MAKRSAIRDTETILRYLRSEIGHDREADLYLDSLGAWFYQPTENRAGDEVELETPAEDLRWLLMIGKLIDSSGSGGRSGLYYLPPRISE